MRCFSVACLRTASISNAGSLDPYQVRRDGGRDRTGVDGASVGAWVTEDWMESERTEFNKPIRAFSESLL